MKTKAIRILAFFLGLNILFSTTGMAFYEHSCSMFAKTFVSPKEAKPCCEYEIVHKDSHDDRPQFKQDQCCKSHAFFKKVNGNTSLSVSKLIFTAIAESLPNRAFAFSPYLVLPTQLSLHHFAKPPPKSGRTHLVLYQQYLI
ncbi:hypothetical protein LAG90_04645 [Marinilongibacter aquaticus]|uniref:HYC_CC_PP family protein n=1 Tax=Marinilongibacter aquaticus TaxID=2975157 RepID=UPI0021BD6203|nr:hypothetical protein [Marinilongibacter aquaticus]UBM59936.1 hypothetical protein LAG90_04645 [Marinilongibacter aquaticus]